MDRHLLESNLAPPPRTLRMHLPQGACLALDEGTSGRNQRHGESKSGFSPTTSPAPAYSPSLLSARGQGCGDGTSMRLRLLFRHIQRRTKLQRPRAWRRIDVHAIALG